MSLIVSIAWIEPMMPGRTPSTPPRSEEHTSELQSRSDLVCRLLLEKKKKQHRSTSIYTNEHNVQESKDVRTTLRLVKIHLMGSSYGGALTIASSLSYHRNLRKRIL